MRKLTRRRERFEGLSVGLDVHLRVIQFSVLDRSGDEVENDRVAARLDEVRRLVLRLQEQGPVQVSLEATGCFLWIYDLLVELVGSDRVCVAAPSRVRVIAESSEKSDVTDAWWLAYLLFEGRLPEAFVAEGALRELRVGCREYRSVTDERADLMRRMKSHLAQLGHRFLARDWASAVGWQRIQTLVDSLSGAGVRGDAIRRLWQRIQELTEEQMYWKQKMEEHSKGLQEIRTIDDVMPGMGPTLSAIIWSELGDPRRYRSAKAYAKATGLSPGYRESAGRRHKRCITREGNAHARWVLTRAVVACLRCTRGPGVAVKRWVEARSRRTAKKHAIVAAARKLAEGIWRLFQRGEAFDAAKAFGGVSA